GDCDSRLTGLSSLVYYFSRRDWGSAVMSFESLPTSIRSELRSVCDAFGNSWNAGQRPRIEDYTSGRIEPARTLLLAELLRIELTVRREAGECPTTLEYLSRFGTDADVVRTAFHDYDPNRTADSLSPPTEPATDAGSPSPGDLITTAFDLPDGIAAGQP